MMYSCKIQTIEGNKKDIHVQCFDRFICLRQKSIITHTAFAVKQLLIDPSYFANILNNKSNALKREPACLSVTDLFRMKLLSSSIRGWCISFIYSFSSISILHHHYYHVDNPFSNRNCKERPSRYFGTRL